MRETEPRPPRVTRTELIGSVAAFAVGGGLAAWFLFSEGMRSGAIDLLTYTGDAYQSRYEAVADPRAKPNTSEYLVKLAGEVDEAVYLAYFESQPGIEYLSESIYPNTVRVALTVPVGETLAALDEQPFVSFTIRNFPFLFCH